MTVGRICVREVHFAEPQETVQRAAEQMRQRDVGTLLVLDKHQHPVGLVTDRDLVRRAIAQKQDPETTRVESVMTPAPKMISEGDSIEHALALMQGGRFRRLPVIDREDKLVGLVTLDDVLMLLAEEFGQIGRLLEHQTLPKVAAPASR